MLRDVNVQCDNVIEARRRDITAIDKKERKRKKKGKKWKSNRTLIERLEDCGNSKWQKSFL